MKAVGIDLAGSEKNDTGLCLLDVKDEKKVVTRLVKSDDEILDFVDKNKPDIIAVDAPLSNAKNGFMRRCDQALREYGALPLNLRGMTYLVERGNRLAPLICGRHRTIEVFVTASAKILGVFNKEPEAMQKSLLSMKLQGDIANRLLTKDELDAIVAAVTGYLHLEGKSEAVGDEDEGWIVIPKV